jgi:type II secretory pathway component PulF
MPLGHRKLSAWYHILAQQLEAGLSLADALLLSRGTGMPSYGLDAMAETIRAGGSTEEALNKGSIWLPLPDRLLLSAAAAAGRMPRTLHVLSVRHAQLGAAKLRALLACLYPAAVLHLGLFLLPVVRMIDWETGFSWDTAAYVRGLSFTVIPLWTAMVAVWVLVRQQNPLIERLSRMTPIVGKYLRVQALSDFSFGLGNFLEAGMPIDRAWATAGAISRSPELKSAAKLIGPVIARGEPPGPKLAEMDCFPPDFIALYRTGEASGQLEQNLLRLSTQKHEQAQRALSLATVVYPGLMFLCVAAGVGYFVISIYGGYLKMLTGIAEQ